MAIITSTTMLTRASKSQIKRRVLWDSSFAPSKEFHQTKGRGHHQQAIDKIRAFGLGTATPMVMI
jgi:hypothetical protein